MRQGGKNILVAVTGASGTIYARQVMEFLSSSDEVGRIGLVVSRRGEEVAAWEGVELPAGHGIERFDNDDMFSSPASGSAPWDAMVVVPCSMGCAGRIAAGVSGDLIGRAADVMVKERRPLILVVRETPFSLIHLRNMAALTEAGAVVMPASPGFYSHPETVEDLCRSVTERIVAHLGIGGERYEWGK